MSHLNDLHTVSFTHSCGVGYILLSKLVKVFIYAFVI